MLAVSGDKGFNRYFWQVYNDTKTRPKDVFDRLDHFDSELERYGVREITEGCEKVESQEERVRDYASLLNSERWPKQTDWVVLEHDAECRILIEQLRGAGNIRVSNARFWFLTYDGKLPRFARRVPENGDPEPELPFCISPSALVQIIRALTPRTEDFETTVVDLLTSPFVGYRRAVDPAVVQEVIGRMDHFNDASPGTALAVLMDTAKVQEIEDAVSTADEDTVEEAVKTAYSTKAREMEEAVIASQERAAKAEQARDEAQARISEIEEEHARRRAADEQAQRERQTEWEREREALQDQIAKEGDARGSAESAADERIKKLEDKLADHDERRQRNRQIAIGVTLILVGMMIGLVPALVLFSGKWAIAGAAVAGLGIVLIGVRVILGPKLGGEFWMWLAAIAAIGGIAAVITATISH